ncbi:MAG: hypothetical protein Q9220_002004 [cf. Caloplaca sp. 1 TL-2023]
MVQAKSLSSVVELADNPPASPEISLEIQDPLVLYIARVPGSKDVFLTTAKPLQKVVTAQDVQSSLYYIHVNSEDDEVFRNSSEKGIPADSKLERFLNENLLDNGDQPLGVSSHPESGTVPKDLFSKKSNVDTGHHVPKIQVHHPFVKPEVKRKPVSPTRQPKTSVSTKHPSPNARVGGPRPMHASHRSVEVSSLAGAQGKENIAPRRWSEQPPTSPHPPGNPPYLQDSKNQASSSSENKDRPVFITQASAPQFVSHNERRPSAAGMGNLTLTVIRRYDGSQSNVASISRISQGKGYPEYTNSFPHDDVSIHIATPGYAKFCSPNPGEASMEPHAIFERRLCRFRSAIASGSHADEKDGIVQYNRRSRFSVDFRRPSQSYSESESKSSSPYKETQDNRSTGIKDYGFYSPWNGTCEFTPGITGHALKCKHTPLASGSSVVTVSELRFNLPSHGSPVSPSKILGSPARPNNTKRISYFSNNSRSDSTHEKSFHRDRCDEEDEMHDTSRALGQEHAGGGFGGKQAKLGKLIVGAEGLKMLDLIVATNIGLWWKAYEKTA